jgi:hypothetical protein
VDFLNYRFQIIIFLLKLLIHEDLNIFVINFLILMCRIVDLFIIIITVHLNIDHIIINLLMVDFFKISNFYAVYDFIF